MNRTFFFFLTGLCLLLLALACRHTPDVVVPVDPELPVSETVTTPTGSTILSTTYTIPMSPETAYANVPQPPSGCNVTRIVYKTVYIRGAIVGQERVYIDGKVFLINTRTVTDYTRDSQGRMIKERRLNPLNLVDSILYTYTPNHVAISENIHTGINGDRTTYQTYKFQLDLNSRGFTARGYWDNQTKYDNDGFLIAAESDFRSYSATVSKGNIQEETTFNGGGFGFQTDKYTYFLKQPNFPNLEPFYGTKSKSLPAGFVRSSFGTDFYPPGDQYRMYYMYIFDNLGRVRRQISYAVRLKSTWPYEVDPSGIAVRDYEYDCP